MQRLESMMPRSWGAALGVLALLLLPGAEVSAAPPVPTTVAYQAFLTDAAGRPVDGRVKVTFALYDTATGGTPLWSEAQTLNAVAGRLRVSLGAVEPLTIPDAFAKPTFLGITVDGDVEMTPRERLELTPYAARAVSALTAEDAGTLGGTPASGFFRSTGGTITGNTDLIAELTVTETLTAAGGLKFADGSVQTTAAGPVSLPGHVTVAPSGGDFTSIQAAINSVTPSAAAPIVVRVMPGEYVERIKLKSHLTLKGAGSKVTRVLPDLSEPDTDADLTVINARGVTDVAISGLSLSGGDPSGARGVFGVYVADATVSMTDMHFEGFTNDGFGLRIGCGLAVDAATVRVSDSAFTGNELGGICVFEDGHALIAGSAFEANGVELDGGGVAVFAGSATVDGSRFVANNYGVLAVEDDGSSPLQGVTVVGNRFLDNGTGVAVFGGEAEILGNFIDDGGSGTGRGIRFESNSGGARILGNTILGHDYGILAGEAPTLEIVGNRVEGAGLRGIALDPPFDNPAVIWGNQVTGTLQPNAEEDEQIITATGIRLESTASAVTVSAGGSTITLAADGSVTVSSAGDVSVNAGRDLNLTAARDVNVAAARNLNLEGATVPALSGEVAVTSATGDVTIQSRSDVAITSLAGDVAVQSALNIDVSSSLNLSLRGLMLNARAGGTATLEGSRTVIKGAPIELN